MAGTLHFTDSAQVHRGDPRVIEDMVASPGALLTGHFELLSGLHTDRFLAFSTVARDEAALTLIAQLLLPEIAAQMPAFVLAPSTAGVALGWWLARGLGVPLHLASLDDHGRPAGLIGEPEVTGRRGLLVNDVLTTGQAFARLAGILTARGSETACSAWFLTRSTDADIESLIGAPAFPIVTLPLEAWAVEKCGACHAGEPVQPALDLN
jgi:orotate phosphoribosyltransferase